ncbi:unnamed protein product [Ostreobium quekettii]|uniref:Uncharacterized protein n=1 Tax=Ostreobium quekettii TaxID=121088 RepID=A0A8S1JF04_9CHLO|nr:unnamed protein product [Ostreobium quekettii]|eukprot:evm.model.scf_658EXC.2 EVM.evm.TU.scf_658EXC.2   scf_658EXC:29118-32855(+)
MHPFWLTFRDGALEGRYLRDVFYGPNRDRALALAALPLLAASLWHEYSLLGSSETFLALAALGACTVAMLHAGARLALLRGCDGYANGRIVWSVGCRLVRSLGLALALHVWTSRGAPGPSPPLRDLCFRSSLASLAAHHMAFPLPFHHGVIVTGVTILSFVPPSAATFCDAARRKEGAEFRSAISSVDRLLTGVSDVLLAPLRGALKARPASSADALAGCEPVVTFLYVGLGFLVPTYGLWLWERASRADFATTLPREENKRVRIDAAPAAGPLAHAGIMVLASSCIWRALIEESWTAGLVPGGWGAAEA